MEKVEVATVKEERPKKKKKIVRFFFPCYNHLLKWEFNSLKKKIMVESSVCGLVRFLSKPNVSFAEP